MRTFDLELTFISDWHIGSGSGVVGGADRSLRRSSDGIPFVPGKTLTGVLRDEARTIAHGLGGVWPDIYDRTFGSAGGQQSKIRIRPLRPVSALLQTLETQPLVAQHFGFSRASVKLDDEGLAEEKKLFVTELGRAGSAFIGTIETADDLGDAGMALVVTALGRVRRLGARRRRGLGRCDLKSTVLNTMSRDDIARQLNEPSWPHAEATARRNEAAGAASTSNLVKVPITIQLETEITALARTIGNVRTSHTFVPGSMLLNPLVRAAGGWQLLGPLVFSGKIQVSNAYPAPNGARLLPAPEVLHSPKRVTPEGPVEIMNSMTEEPPAGWKPLRGAYVGANNEARLDLYRQPLVFFSHAAVDETVQRPTSRVGGVYSNRALPRGTTLQAVMTVPQDHCPKPGTKVAIEIGASRKDDYGSATATFGESLDGVVPENRADTVTVWLTSDTILLDANLTPDTTAEGLAKAIGKRLGLEDPQVHSARIRTTRREGWSAASGVPRPTFTCIAAGSVIRIGGAADTEALADLERRGIGERTAEGFGELLCNHEALDLTELVTVRPDSAQPVPPAGGNDAEWLIVRAVEAQASRVAPLVAPKLARYLKLNTAGPDGIALTRTQLGSLREAATALPSQPGTLAEWLQTVRNNDARTIRWGNTLTQIGNLNDTPSAVLARVTEDLGSTAAVVALTDESPELQRHLVAVFLVAALKWAHVEAGRSS